MPTSGAPAFRVGPSARCWAPWVAADSEQFGAAPEKDGGGQSAVGEPGMLSPGPDAVGAGPPPALGLGPCMSGQGGKRAGCETRERRRSGADWEGKEGIAHLTCSFSLFLRYVKNYFAFASPWRFGLRLAPPSA